MSRGMNALIQKAITLGFAMMLSKDGKWKRIELTIRIQQETREANELQVPIKPWYLKECFIRFLSMVLILIEIEFDMIVFQHFNDFSSDF
jgi:hypothetical protein